ncbi:hypothetical protein F0562_013458 [Nyssa sinensis]|uniref:Uncharacterized protein n=1 Tax=Nyssa sinensis TaxID=561372 RepID=A0A5J4ZNY9_9ASTE|nr:hypothetical protein F0562_013458 [Nyssa sinensis]
MILDQSGDKHPTIEEDGLSPAQPETESLENMVVQLEIESLENIVPPPSDLENMIVQPETESLGNIVPPPSDMPHQSLTEDVPETHKRQLPYRHTRVSNANWIQALDHKLNSGSIQYH